MKVYIYGTGVIAGDYVQRHEIRDDELAGFVQTVRTSDRFCDRPVFEPCEIAGENFDYIIVCVKGHTIEIRDTCLKAGIPLEKLIFIDNFQWFDKTPMSLAVPYASLTRRVNEKQDNHYIKNRFPILYEYIQERETEVSRYSVIMRNGSDLRDQDVLLLSEAFASRDYQTDYFRYRTFEMNAGELIRRNVPGAVAELGVFKGVFARMINGKFKDRTCYLFDTFESFDDREFREEVSKGRCQERFIETFYQTSVQAVLAQMPYPDQCVVRKGLFPDTAAGLENERYAFVSIDVDFEKSILEGLRYFYPALNQNGVIFIHDYNNRFLEGVRAAVEIYEQETGISLVKVPLADEGGTLVVVKP